MALPDDPQARLRLAVNDISSRQLEAMRLSYGNVTGGNDAKRTQAWCEYGFKQNLDFYDFLRLYERHGVAHGAVHVLLDKCWESCPEVIQGDEDDDADAERPWEKKLEAEFRRLKVWRALKEADRMRLVGHYAAVLLQVKDNKAWDQPISGGKLAKLIPAWEGQLIPATWDDVPTSPTYGEPSMWTYQEASVKENDNTAPGRSVSVHPDRVVLIGDYRTGTPFLKAGFNDCVTIEKVIGGAGESFLKNASRQLNINFDKDTEMSQVAAAYGVPLADLHSAFDEVARGMNRGMDNVLATQGASVTSLVSTVPDPTMPFNVALQSFCASVQLPNKVVIGTQTGVLAGDADTAALNKRGQGRRVHELTYDIEDFVQRLIDLKFLDKVPGDVFTICWDDLSEATPSEKLANAKILADINTAGLGTGDRYFSAAEVRTAADYDSGKDELKPLPETPAPADPAIDPNNPDASLPTDEPVAK